MFGFFRKTKETPKETIKYKRSSVIDSANYADRLLKDLTVSDAETNAEVILALPKVRNRSRSLYHNSDYLRKFVLSAQRNIVGDKAPVFNSTASENDGTPDKLARIFIEREWKDFCENKHVDLNGQLSMVEMCHLWVQSLIVDGSFLAIKHRGKKAGKYGYCIQPIDNRRLDLQLNETVGKNRIIGGIEFDYTGRPLKYYIIDQYFGDYRSPNTGRNYLVVDAKDIIYDFRVKFIGQTHGTPETWSSINTIHQINETEKSALVAARHGATKMGFIESTDAGAGDYVGDFEDTDGTIISEFQAGSIEELPYGKHYVAHDPKYPHEQLAVFMKSQLRKLASGWGMSYADLTDDLDSVNLSSYRGSTNEARETWKLWQGSLIDMLNEIYGDWLEMALMKGMIGKLPFAKYDKFYAHTFQGRRWFRVDPIKDEQANEMAHNMRTKSLSEIIKDRGRDPEEVYAEIETDNQRLAELGLKIVQQETQNNETKQTQG